MSLLIVGDDGVARCAWATSAPDYVAYHDDEWGRRVRGERELFERLTLESFQSGLSWLTILRKREAFRAAFVGFEPDVVAALGVADVERLMGDASIVRNRRKIEAAVTNARAVVELRADGGLEALIDTFPPAAHERPTTVADVVGSSDESAALAKELKRRGFAHVGPTTCYSLMQACGYVNDHAAGCVVGDAIERLAG
ncbi:DNA-3-methyladenine glycosylase I [Dermacoccus sp. GAS27A]|uniref:DNA-3-methyladenine glycosylase I n=1 Tax=Dermacoccus sp. GAS27A TaxID=3156270 RepID=UPI003833ED04